MRYEVRDNQESKWGIISNSHGFLKRHLDTGFKTKWSGFWAPPIKYLDYYAIQVNGLWLNSETLQAAEYGDDFNYHHETESLQIEEKVTTPEGFPGFKITLEITNPNDSRKAVHSSLEPGIDIRKRTDDVPEEDHDLEVQDDRIIASRNSKKLIISSDSVEEVTEEPRKNEHFPGERQVCMVPGRMSFRTDIAPGETETIEIDFRTDNASFHGVERSDSELKDSKIARGFNYSLRSMDNLFYGHEKGGIIAGHPWFQNYWARDSFWSVLGLVDAGMFETATTVLENFASRQGFPNKIRTEDGRAEHGGADAAPLFIIAADKLEKHYELTELIEEKQQEAMETLKMEKGVVEHDPQGTWMDTLERSPAVEIQSLWLRAADIMDDDAHARLESGLRDFEEGGRVLDTPDEDSPNTINFSVPLMFDQFKDEFTYDYLEMLNGEFSSRHGARTRSMADPGYKSSGYHTGSCWGLTTCWAAMANLRHGKNKEGVNMLETMTKFLDRNQIGALPEVVDAETGELLGCGEQAWSAALFVHAVDSYLLGIKVKDDHVEINPSPGVEMKRLNKRIGDEKLDLKVKNGEVEILNSPDLEIIKW